MSELDTLQTELLAQVEKAASLADLDAVRVSVLGKKGKRRRFVSGGFYRFN